MSSLRRNLLLKRYPSARNKIISKLARENACFSILFSTALPKNENHQHSFRHFTCHKYTRKISINPIKYCPIHLLFNSWTFVCKQKCWQWDIMLWIYGDIVHIAAGAISFALRTNGWKGCIQFAWVSKHSLSRQTLQKSTNLIVYVIVLWIDQKHFLFSRKISCVYVWSSVTDTHPSTIISTIAAQV